MSMGTPIDITRMKEYKPPPTRKFLKLRPPDENTFYGYRITVVSEPEDIDRLTQWGPRIERHVDVQLIEAVNDKDTALGDYRLNITPAMLKRIFEDLSAKGSLVGRTFDVMHRGTIRTKAGMKCNDYVVIEQEGKLSINTLLRQLFEPEAS